MMLVRALAAFAKPALIGGTLTVAAGAAYTGYDHWRGDGATPFERVQQQGQRLLVSEFGDKSDTIVAVNPDDPADRTVIATIDHAPGYGIFAALAPDGDAFAYTALPSSTGRPSPDTPADAAIVEADGDVTLLATDVDLLIPPVWSPDGESIVVRKNTPEEGARGTFDLILLGRDGARRTLTTWRSAAVFPIGFAPDGATLYFATLNEGGTDLYRIGADGSDEALVSHLSDEVARDWRLSPDGATLAYSVAETGPPPAVVAMTLDLATAAASRVTSADGAAELNPAWRGDDVTISSVDAGGGSSVTVDARGASSTLSESDDSIDLPLAWAPDGSTLAVRSVDDPTTGSARGSYVELIRVDGSRTRASDSPDALIVGWMP